MTKTTTEYSEINKFNELADSWWNEESGEMALLHQMNPARVSFIKKHITEQIKGNNDKNKIKILDVGCGAGILTEPMARLGYIVTGLDAAENSINIARNRSRELGLNIEYICGSIEDFTFTNSNNENANQKFDVITALEIIEHVQNPDSFIKYCFDCLKPGGLLFFSTINRTLKSYLGAIIGAEYIAKIVKKGTHDWNKFIKPSEIYELIRNDGDVLEIKGMTYNPISKTWKIKDNGFMDINYIGVAKKSTT